MSIREIFRSSNLENKIVGILIFLFPVFFLTVKGWANAVALLLMLLALGCILFNIRFFLKRRDKLFWTLFACLLIPFLSELSVQILRGEIVWSFLDGPSRFLAAAILFVFLSRKKTDYSTFLFWGAVFSTTITFISVYFFRQHFWPAPDGTLRAATYFVDPITLPVYLLACFSLVASGIKFSFSDRQVLVLALTLILFSLVAAVILLSQSRTPWVACVALFQLLILIRSKDKKSVLGLNLLVLAGVILLVMLSDTLTARILAASREFEEYFREGGGDTSVGLRLGLLRMDYELFVGFFPFGVADGQLPPIGWFDDRGFSVSEVLFRQKLLTGSHNEIAGQLVRKGVFGIPTIISLFVIPFVIFREALISNERRVAMAGCMGLAFCTVILSSGMFIQTFNLKMTSTFYSFVLAVLFASCLRQKAKNA